MLLLSFPQLQVRKPRHREIQQIGKVQLVQLSIKIRMWKFYFYVQALNPHAILPT